MERYFNDEWNLPSRKVAEEVFKNSPVQEERKMNLYQYCLSIGGLRAMSSPDNTFLNICHNEKCVNCRHLEEVFNKELKNWLNDSKKESL